MQPARVLDDQTVGTLLIGDVPVRRLGFGAMRISGARNAEGVRDREEARALVRRVIERGVNFIDTADIYGYGQSEEIIFEAIAPYPEGLLISTKAGFEPRKMLPGELSLPPRGDPEQIKRQCDLSLQRLGLDHLEHYQVHVPDPKVPYEETVGAFVELQNAGKVRHIGVSNVTVEQLRLAQRLCTVVSVQNKYNAGERGADAVLEVCEHEGIPFLAWQPVAVDDGARGVVQSLAAREGVSEAQIALAWILTRSPMMLPIPGTSQIRHLDDNVDAAWVTLDDDDVTAINDAVGGA